MGYIFTPDMRGKCFFLFQGPHDSGKSVLGRFIKDCFETEAVSALDLHSLGQNFAKADLIGKRLCADFDLSAGALDDKAASALKKLTGGDIISSDVKYMPRVSFVNTAKFLYASNHAVLGPYVDEAFARRMIVVPFYKTIPAEEQDFELSEKLAMERDAVIVQALPYYYKLRENRYQFAGSYDANRTVESTEDLDTALCEFLTECCQKIDDAWISTEKLYSAFIQGWGITCRKNTFSERFLICAREIYPSVEKNEAELQELKIRFRVMSGFS